MGSINDNGAGGYYGYRMSMVALNMNGHSLELDLNPRDTPPQLAARGLFERIDALRLERSGRLWHANGELRPW